jgi:hypothetical protein
VLPTLVKGISQKGDDDILRQVRGYLVRQKLSSPCQQAEIVGVGIASHRVGKPLYFLSPALSSFSLFCCLFLHRIGSYLLVEFVLLPSLSRFDCLLHCGPYFLICGLFPSILLNGQTHNYKWWSGRIVSQLQRKCPHLPSRFQLRSGKLFCGIVSRR